MKYEIYFLLPILAIAVIQDIGSYKIRNYLTVFGSAAGLAYNLALFGSKGFYYSIPGFLIPLFLLFPIYYIRGFGAGDLKLFSAIGSFIGFSRVFNIIITSIYISAFIILIQAIVKGDLKEKFSNIYFVFWYMSKHKKFNNSLIKPDKNNRIHLSIPISAAYLAQFMVFFA